MSTSDSSSGWIKIHRDILNWDFYRDNETKLVWFHLLLNAAWKKEIIDGVEILPGQIFIERYSDFYIDVFKTKRKKGEDKDKFEKNLQCKLSNIFNKLKKVEQILVEQNKAVGKKWNNLGTTVTICNWYKYQQLEEQVQINKLPEPYQNITRTLPEPYLINISNKIKKERIEEEKREDVSEPATGIPSTGAETKSIIETKVEKEKIQSIVKTKKYSEMDDSERYHELLSILDTFQKNTSIKFHRTPENLNALKQIANTRDFSRSDFRRALVCFFDEKCNWLSSKTLKTLESKFPEISSLLCETGHTYDEYLDETNKKIVRSGRKVSEITLEELGEIYKKVFK